MRIRHWCNAAGATEAGAVGANPTEADATEADEGPALGARPRGTGLDPFPTRASLSS